MRSCCDLALGRENEIINATSRSAAPERIAVRGFTFISGTHQGEGCEFSFPFVRCGHGASGNKDPIMTAKIRKCSETGNFKDLEGLSW